jgi:hypothetical protein
MKNALKRMWKEVVVAELKVLPWYFLGEIKDFHINFNIILPTTLRSSKLFLSLGFPTNICAHLALPCVLNAWPTTFSQIQTY